jgi:hypothetical protein
MPDCCQDERNLSRIVNESTSMPRVWRQCLVCGSYRSIDILAPPILNAPPDEPVIVARKGMAHEYPKSSRS